MADDIEKPRLDQALVARGLVVSRARASDLIRRGEVKVDNVVMRKPAYRVQASATLSMRPGAGDYVSRGALKLRAALDTFEFDARGRVALDIGASTGGFTEVLLDRGSPRVFAVDNGRDQLHPTLRRDPRVISLEETDARRLTPELIPGPVGAIVADVSFISLAKVLPVPMNLAARGCWLVGLIKPQFEAEPAWIPKDGVITDRDVHEDAVAIIKRWLDACAGWRVVGTIESPIKGGDGNTEFLIGAIHARD